MKIIPEWLTGKNIIPAAEVKKMPVGSKVWIHKAYGKTGEHLYNVATIVKAGPRKKKLKYSNYQGLSEYADIVDKENVAYTEVTEEWI